MSQNQAFILGFGSPRRQDLLNQARYQFTTEPSSAEELHNSDMDVRDLTQI